MKPEENERRKRAYNEVRYAEQERGWEAFKTFEQEARRQAIQDFEQALCDVIQADIDKTMAMPGVDYDRPKEVGKNISFKSAVYKARALLESGE